MAFAVESSSSTGGLLGSAGPTLAHTVTAANKIVAVICTADSTPTDRVVTSVAWNGTALTLVGLIDDTNFEHVEIWELHSPAAGAFNLVAVYGGGVAQSLMTVTGFTDAHATLGTPATAFAPPASQTANPSVTATTVSGDIVIGGVSTDLGDSGTTTEDFTLIAEAENVDNDSDFNVQRRTASGTSTALSWTSGSNAWAAIGVAVKDAGGAGGRTTKNTQTTPLGTDLGMGLWMGG